MQKVERRKHGERRHGRLGWVLLCVLLLAGCVTAAVLMLNKSKEEPPAGHAKRPGAITRRKREELKSLDVSLRSGESWTAVLRDGKLWITDGTKQNADGWAADELLGNQLLDAAVNLAYEDILTEDPGEWKADAEDFGLETPLVTAVICFTDETEVTVRIGNSADPDNDAFHYMTVDGDDRLYALPAGTVQELSMETSLLRAVPRLNIRAVLLDRITVKDRNGNVRVSWELEGKVTDQDAAENWKITVPFTYPADYDMMKNLRTGAENLRLGTYAGAKGEIDPEETGFDGGLILEFHMTEGSTGTVGESGVYDVTDWEEETVTLTTGAAKTEMTDYVLYDGNVYTISHFSLSVFTEADGLSTAARYPAATPLSALDSLLTEQEGREPVLYSLIREEETAVTGQNTEEPAVRCMKNGEEIAYDSFAAAYERLMTVTVSGKLPDGFEPGETHTKYTFRTVSGGTHTVELSDYDGIHDAMTMDGGTLFYLIRGGMTELP